MKKMKNKKLITTFIFISLLGIFSLQAFAKEALPVFYSTTVPANARAKAMKGDLSGAFDVTVFAKYKDFIREVKKVKPAAVIAPSSFSDYHKDYEPAAQFIGGGKPTYKFLLLAAEKKWNKGNINKGKIGMVEISKRKNLKKITKKMFGKKFKRVKSVSKPEDLFPLLVFKSVDFILVSPGNYKILKTKFSTKVVEVAKSKSVNHPKLFVKKGSDKSKLTGALKKLSSGSLKKMGFSKVQ